MRKVRLVLASNLAEKTMRIQVLSDLHREVEAFDYVASDADVVVFAGDIDNKLRGLRWIQSLNIGRPVIYVPGNHEYYGDTYQKLNRKLIAETEGTNIHVLVERAVKILDVTFHGATLWTDFSMFGDPVRDGQKCQVRMNDYRYIRREPTYSKMRSIDIFNIHKEALAWLDTSLLSSNTDRNFVITHHAPSITSIPIEDRYDFMSAAYASDLNEFIKRHEPQLWIHGHLHRSLDYSIGSTRIVCNAKGHHRRFNPMFDPKFVLNL